MKKKLLVLLFSLASLALVACGGGNDVASSGATAVSAATTPSTTPATPTTEPKVNGQVDERTGVAPVVAAMTIAQTVTACEASAAFGGTGPLVIDVSNPTQQSNPTLPQCWDALPGYAWGSPWVVTLYGGCARSSSFGGSEPALTLAQKSACITAIDKAENLEQCFSLGGKSWTVGKGSGGCDVGLVVQSETVTVPDYSNGGCGKSSTFGGNEPALNVAQQIACQKAFGNTFTFQQCFSLGGIWASLPKIVIDGAGHERTGICGFRKCSPNEQTGLCE